MHLVSDLATWPSFPQTLHDMVQSGLTFPLYMGMVNDKEHQQSSQVAAQTGQRALQCHTVPRSSHKISA